MGILFPKRNYGCRVHEIQVAGMRALVLQNKFLRVTLLLDKGADIIEFLHKPTDTDWMGISPQGLRNPRDIQVSIPGHNGALMDSYEGGWQEVFPNGGDACQVQGIEYGQHGEAALLAWDASVEVDTPENVRIRLTTSTLKTPFRLEKILTLEEGKSTLFIEEKITNLGRESIPIMWGQHPAFGAPALNLNCQIVLPECKVHSLKDLEKVTRRTFSGGSSWPSAPDSRADLSVVLPENAEQERMYFLSGFKEGWYGINDLKAKTGFGLSWSIESYPYLWYWQNSGSLGRPWFGQAYLLALEPFSSPIPQLNRALEKGWAVWVAAGGSMETWITATATYDQPIHKVHRDGSIL